MPAGRFGVAPPDPEQARAQNARAEAERYLSPTFLPSISPERRAQLVKLLSAEFEQSTSSIRGHPQTATPWQPRLLTPAEQREHLIQGQKGGGPDLIGSLVGRLVPLVGVLNAINTRDRAERLQEAVAGIRPAPPPAPPVVERSAPLLRRLDRPLPPPSAPAADEELSGPQAILLIVALALVSAFFS